MKSVAETGGNLPENLLLRLGDRHVCKKWCVKDFKRQESSSAMRFFWPGW